MRKEVGIMEVTKEQIASDIVRNLSEALARLLTGSAYQESTCDIRISIEKKLQKWIMKL